MAQKRTKSETAGRADTSKKTTPRAAKPKSLLSRTDQRQLAALRRVGLLAACTEEEVAALVKRCDEEAAEDPSPYAYDGDPRDVEPGWLSEPLARLLMERERDRVVDRRTTLDELVSLAARLGMTAEIERRGRRRFLRIADSGAKPELCELGAALDERTLADIASSIHGLAGDARPHFVPVRTDPRFFRGGFYLRVSDDDVEPLTEAEIVRESTEDEPQPEIRWDPPPPGARAAAASAKPVVRRIGVDATRGPGVEPAIVAMPLGGNWTIPGEINKLPRGPEATNIRGSTYNALYAVRGWGSGEPARPGEDYRRSTGFHGWWSGDPGVAALVVDGGAITDEQDRERAVRGALLSLKEGFAACPKKLSGAWLTGLVDSARAPGLEIAALALAGPSVIAASTSGAVVAEITAEGRGVRVSGARAPGYAACWILGGRAVAASDAELQALVGEVCAEASTAVRRAALVVECF